MTCLQLCVLFNFQICGTFPPVFMNIFFRSRLTLYKCVVSAFIQRSWRIRNWTIEDGLFSCGIFLDFSKAFDTADRILLKKSTHYGIRGIANDWFASYLSNRRQYVTIGSIKSDDTLITNGFPQGSVLGPLLFLLYINWWISVSAAMCLTFTFWQMIHWNLFYSANSNLAELESIVN